MLTIDIAEIATDHSHVPARETIVLHLAEDEGSLRRYFLKGEHSRDALAERLQHMSAKRKIDPTEFLSDWQLDQVLLDNLAMMHDDNRGQFGHC